MITSEISPQDLSEAILTSLASGEGIVKLRHTLLAFIFFIKIIMKENNMGKAKIFILDKLHTLTKAFG